MNNNLQLCLMGMFVDIASIFAGKRMIFPLNVCIGCRYLVLYLHFRAANIRKRYNEYSYATKRIFIDLLNVYI